MFKTPYRPCRRPRRQLYHCERNNPAGATRQLRKGMRKLEPYLPWCEQVETAWLLREVQEVLRAIESGAPVSVYPRIHLSSARTNSS
jgi:hypothetical protein